MCMRIMQYRLRLHNALAFILFIMKPKTGIASSECAREASKVCPKCIIAIMIFGQLDIWKTVLYILLLSCVSWYAAYMYRAIPTNETVQYIL